MLRKVGLILTIELTGFCYVIHPHLAKLLLVPSGRIRGDVAFAPFKSRKMMPRGLEQEPDSVLA